ncbi:MAG: hypothetical protein LBS16_05480 [Prevotellaceae bacterium]|jgi:hypothetical protein|nr:hypothetical protein [Prevotellaceae bacterium]
MKSKLFFLSAVAATLMSGCSNVAPEYIVSESVSNLPSLAGTQWKLAGIFIAHHNLQEKDLKPVDCEKCYTLSFDSDTTATGISVDNTLAVNLKQQSPIRTVTDISESGDAGLFCELLPLITSYIYKKKHMVVTDQKHTVEYDFYFLDFFYRKDDVDYFLEFYRLVNQ